MTTTVPIVNLDEKTYTKQELRQEVRRRRAGYSQNELDELSLQASAKLLGMPIWQEAHTVLLYHSLPDELSTGRLIQRAVEQGKQVLLPVVVGDDLELREYTSEQQLAEGAFHIREPQGEAFTDYDAIDLAVVPGVAFSSDLFRVGRGRGYYDRLLPRLTKAVKCGICWPFQFFQQVPTEPHDVRLDAIIV